MRILLEPEQRQRLLLSHRSERDGCIRDRIKAVLLRDDGYSYEQIAQVLFLSDEAIRKHIDDFVRENKLKPENGGSEARLDGEQTAKLLTYLDEQIYVHVKDICDYVWAQFGVTYSRNGIFRNTENRDYGFWWRRA